MIAMVMLVQVTPPITVEMARQRSEAALPICTTRMGAQLVRALADLPPDVLAAVQRDFADRGGLAESGQPFNSTDVVDPGLPSRQFRSAVGHNGTWLIWYTHGGRGLHHHLVGFETRSGEARLSRSLMFGASNPETVCAVAQAVFDGARSGGTEY